MRSIVSALVPGTSNPAILDPVALVPGVIPLAVIVPVALVPVTFVLTGTVLIMTILPTLAFHFRQHPSWCGRSSLRPRHPCQTTALSLCAVLTEATVIPLLAPLVRQVGMVQDGDTALFFSEGMAPQLSSFREVTVRAHVVEGRRSQRR